MSGEERPARSVRVVARAPAKLNLELRVLGRRPDGYHELSSLLVALSLCDRIELRPRSATGAALTVRGPAASADVPADESNLAWRALAAVCELAGADPADWSLALEKRVPSGAGLGGGSSDAAAAALAAAHALELGPEAEAPIVTRLAALGSDCPFFWAARSSGLARCRGRGEQVRALAPARTSRAFCVVTPDVHAATALVYRAWRAEEGARPRDMVPHDVFRAPLADARALLSNGLERAALRAYPELARVRRWLDESGAAHFRLAGSGASFFGLFEDERSAEEARASLEALAARARVALRGAFVTGVADGGATLDSSN